MRIYFKLFLISCLFLLAHGSPALGQNGYLVREIGRSSTGVFLIASSTNGWTVTEVDVGSGGRVTLYGPDNYSRDITILLTGVDRSECWRQLNVSTTGEVVALLEPCFDSQDFGTRRVVRIPRDSSKVYEVLSDERNSFWLSPIALNAKGQIIATFPLTVNKPIVLKIVDPVAGVASTVETPLVHLNDRSSVTLELDHEGRYLLFRNRRFTRGGSGLHDLCSGSLSLKTVTCLTPDQIRQLKVHRASSVRLLNGVISFEFRGMVSLLDLATNNVLTSYKKLVPRTSKDFDEIGEDLTRAQLKYSRHGPLKGLTLTVTKFGDVSESFHCTLPKLPTKSRRIAHSLHPSGISMGRLFVTADVIAESESVAALYEFTPVTETSSLKDSDGLCVVTTTKVPE